MMLMLCGLITFISGIIGIILALVFQPEGFIVGYIVHSLCILIGFFLMTASVFKYIKDVSGV